MTDPRSDDTPVSEEWRPVVGLGGWYEVSDQGRLRTVARSVHCGGNGDRLNRDVPAIVRSPGKTGGGYVSFSLSIRGVQTTRLLHRMVCEAFNGREPFPRAICRHLDDDKQNNAPANLAWGTHADNMADRLRNGHNRARADHPRAILRTEQVESIKARRAAGESVRELSSAFNISPGHIYHLVNGTRW